MGEKKINDIIGYLLFGMSVILAFLVCKAAFSSDIWYDEIFSMVFAKGSVRDIVALTAKDVHPPLYYMYLKMFCFFLSGMDAVQAGKIASSMAMIGVLILDVTWVRKRLGNMAMGIFAILMVSMPQLSGYYVEIRMYSMCMFLITVCFTLLVDITNTETDKIWKWCIFCITGVLTAYTQYFACIAIVALYAMLIVFGLLERREKKYWYKLVAMMVASVILYTPWLVIFKQQLSNVAGSYWIQPMTIRSIPGCLKYIFMPVSGEGKITYVAAGLMIAVTFVAYILFLIKKPDIKELIWSMCGPVALIFIVGVGYVFSTMGSPIFTYRYMIPALGAFYLGTVIAIIKCDRRWLVYVAIIAFGLGGYLTLKNFYYDEGVKAQRFAEASNKLEVVEDECVIITNFDHITALSSYYFDNAKVYIYEGEVDAIVKEIFDYCDFVNDETVKKLVDENDDVYFFGSFVSRDEIVADWEKCGVNSEYIDECMIERYWFNIYRLSSEKDE